MFINIALKKVNDLIKRSDFKSIEYIDEKNITISFTGKCCNVSSFGNVTWSDDNE